MEKIHELNVKTYRDGKEEYYGIDVKPTPHLKQALQQAQNEIRQSDDVTYCVGYWTNGGCYSGGEYHGTKTYHRLDALT